MNTLKIVPSSEHRHNVISLRDAITMELAEQCRLWSVPGLHVKMEGTFACIPDNATIIQTVVAKGPAFSFGESDDMFIGVQWKSEENENLQCLKEQKLSWDMVQKKFPELLDVTGTLYAFSV